MTKNLRPDTCRPTRYAFTAVYTESSSGKGVIGYIEELPGITAQGETVDEARRKLEAAIDVQFAANRFQTHRLFGHCRVLERGTVTVRAAGWEWEN